MVRAEEMCHPKTYKCMYIMYNMYIMYIMYVYMCVCLSRCQTELVHCAPLCVNMNDLSSQSINRNSVYIHCDQCLSICVASVSHSACTCTCTCFLTFLLLSF